MKNLTSITLVIILALVIYLVIDKATGHSAKKIGIVQMEKLMYDFKGMKEATENYTLKMKKWEAQSDSLETRLKAMYDQIRLDSLNKDNSKLERDLKAFVLFRQSYLEYNQKTQELAENEDKQMTMGVVNQVNEYIKGYAEKEKFDVILCNTQQQSVGYSTEQLDVTKAVLDYANTKYEGGK